jgi:hypothetical protein
METLKTLEQPLTKELVESLVGLFIHVPTNLHKINDQEGEREENVWFAGQVAGYEQAVVHFNYGEQTFKDEPTIYYNLLLTDGMGYVLSSEKVEINKLDENEFQAMLEEHFRKAKEEEGEMAADLAGEAAAEYEDAELVIEEATEQGN